MRAFEDKPDILLDPRLDPTLLTFLGVALGMTAKAVPRDRVVEVTFAPLVKSISIEGRDPPQYTDFYDQSQSPENVYASVVHGSGVLHTDADLSFTIDSARVTKVTIHGTWLAMFEALTTLQKLHDAFGGPDLCLRLDADGDTLAYDNYYAASRKWVRWMADVARPTVVTLGDDADALRPGQRGGVSRTRFQSGSVSA